MSRFEAIIFDLDGTLVETAPDLRSTLAEVLAEVDIPAPELGEMRTLIGRGARRMVESALVFANRPYDPPLLDRLQRRFWDLYDAEPYRVSSPYPGVRDNLERFAKNGVRMGVCTNKTQRPSEMLLEALDLSKYFGSIIGSDTLPVHKPDPGHLAAVLDAIGGSAESAVMIGDSITDLDTARALDVPCVLVSFGYTEVPARELGADRVIDHYDELDSALNSL